MKPSVVIRRFGLACVDAILVAIALYLAYLVRFEEYFYELERNQYKAIVLVVVGVRLAGFYFWGLYRGILRYAGIGEMIAIVASTVAGSVLLLGMNFGISRLPLVEWFPEIKGTLNVLDGTSRIERVSLGILAVECLCTIFLVATARFSRRLLLYQVLSLAEETKTSLPRRLMIVGASDMGEWAVRLMKSAPVKEYKPVAFVDDDPEKRNLRIHGVPVAGAINDLPALLKRFHANEVLIAVRDISPERLRAIVSMCKTASIRFRILPTVQDVMTGRVSISQIRPVEIEDLLGREQIQLSLEDDRNYIADQVVMITGAGGSIGSELCRQLIGLGPKLIVLLGHGENSIYEIHEELKANGHGDKVLPAIGDIRDRAKVLAIARAHQPTIFFHAAAHKHVPLMEQYPEEAVKNNVAGTRNVVDAAEAVGAKKFILISSDKAVRPTNVMGATKRVAEMIIFDRARTSTTQLVAVRFGNVLGSRGSVVPLFKKQVAAGGPITLTHADVTRYFMTIPEAVSLVIQAGSMDRQGRLFLLDMGQPIKILDLAKNLIRLSGLEPGKDIEIKFTGLRPGEKLTEELLTEGENVRSTDMGKIFETEPEPVDRSILQSAIEEMELLAADNNSDELKVALQTLVPDYRADADRVQDAASAVASGAR